MLHPLMCGISLSSDFLKIVFVIRFSNMGTGAGVKFVYLLDIFQVDIFLELQLLQDHSLNIFYGAVLSCFMGPFS